MHPMDGVPVGAGSLPYVYGAILCLGKKSKGKAPSTYTRYSGNLPPLVANIPKMRGRA
jgi:hypothetical protein